MNALIKKISIFNAPIYIGSNVFEELNSFIKTKFSIELEIYILVDNNTKEFCLPVLISGIKNLENAKIIEISSGEKNKNIETALFIWQKLSNENSSRKALLINLGGGVICDLGGFVASLYKRGISFINIPTTLMAQVDAGFGGKNGIDFNGFKNQIGTFTISDAVYIYPEFIKSLNKREILSAFAEIIKYSLISKKIHIDNILKCDIINMQDIQNLIINSIETKLFFVTKDFKDNDKRKILNFGHTIGHAIESYYILNDKIHLLHGEAIAIGIICEIFLSVKKLSFPIEIQLKYNDFIIKKFGKFSINHSCYEDIIEIMRNDKKNSSSEINFVLLKQIGETLINQTCTKIDIIESLDYYNNL